MMPWTHTQQNHTLYSWRRIPYWLDIYHARSKEKTRGGYNCSCLFRTPCRHNKHDLGDTQCITRRNSTWKINTTLVDEPSFSAHFKEQRKKWQKTIRYYLTKALLWERYAKRTIRQELKGNVQHKAETGGNSNTYTMV
jgi:hypothetical protein